MCRALLRSSLAHSHLLSLPSPSPSASLSPPSSAPFPLLSDPLARDAAESSGGAVRNQRRQDRSDTRRADPYGRGDRSRGPSGDGAWSRDRGEAPRPQTVQRIIGDTVRLSNLASGTTEDDLRFIFEKVGVIQRAQVNFNAQGQCNGTAEVQFATNMAADEAVKQLDQAEIDGRIMYVHLVGQVVAASLPIVARRRDGARDDGRDTRRDDDRRGQRDGNRDGGNRREPRPERPAGGEKRGAAAAGGNQAGKSARPEKKEVTLADLDSEMDNWHKAAPTAAAAAATDAQPAAAAPASTEAPME